LPSSYLLTHRRPKYYTFQGNDHHIGEKRVRSGGVAGRRARVARYLGVERNPGLVRAFVIGGLREVGEPARKALILDLVPDRARARGVGVYYLIRSLAITPAAVTGGLLWKIAPEVPFLLAGAIGIVGTTVFAATVEERYAR
jgi:hypothetical protein